MEETTQIQGKKNTVRCGKCSHCHLIHDYDPIYGDLWCDSHDTIIDRDPEAGCIDDDPIEGF